MQENRALLTSVGFTALAINGMTYAFMGASLPAIQSYLGITIEQAAMLTALLQTGVTALTLVAGILSDLFRRERILMTGCLLLSGGCFFFGSSSSYTINIIVAGIMGAGMGCVLSGSNTLLVSLYPLRKGTILNIHHVFFGLGSLLGPLIMGYLITRGNQWREGYLGESAVLLILGLIFFFSGGRRPEARKTSLFGSQVSRLLKDKDFLVILAVSGLAVGTQVAVMLLGVTFLVQAKQSTLGAAGTALSIFAVFMVLGRLICSRLTISHRHATIILILLALQTVVLGAAWWGSKEFALGAIALSGFTFSGVYPTLLAMTGRLFPQVEGSALGILSTVGGLGTVILCWLTGRVAGWVDLETGFLVLVFACLSAYALFQINHRALCQREANSA